MCHKVSRNNFILKGISIKFIYLLSHAILSILWEGRYINQFYRMNSWRQLKSKSDKDEYGVQSLLVYAIAVAANDI